MLAGGCRAPAGASWRPLHLASPCLEEPRGARARRRPSPQEALGLSEAAAASGGGAARGRAGAAGGGGAAREPRSRTVRAVLRGAARGGGASASHSAALPLGPPLRWTPDLRTSARSRTPPAGTAAAEKGGFGLSPGLASKRGDPPAPCTVSVSVMPPSGLPSPGASPHPSYWSSSPLTPLPPSPSPRPTFSPAYPTFAPSASPSPSPCAPHPGPRPPPRPSSPNFAPFQPSPLPPSPPPAAPAAAPHRSKPPSSSIKARFPRLRSP